MQSLHDEYRPHSSAGDTAQVAPAHLAVENLKRASVLLTLFSWCKGCPDFGIALINLSPSLLWLAQGLFWQLSLKYFYSLFFNPLATPKIFFYFS